MATIGSDFTLSTLGAEDLKYGFLYSDLKGSPGQSADIFSFQITSPVNGDLYYNASAGAPVYTKINASQFTTGTGVQIRVNGVFINGVKVTSADSHLYWQASTPGFVGTEAAFTVKGINAGVDKIYGTADDVISTDTAGHSTSPGLLATSATVGVTVNRPFADAKL